MFTIKRYVFSNGLPLSLSGCSSKINLCCWVGAPISMTTQRSVSAVPWYLGSNAQTAARKACIYVNSSDFIITLSPATRVHVCASVCCVCANSGCSENSACVLVGV